MKKGIAIITARGGSKGIPRKNIGDFLGSPIISYPIAAALEAGCFDEVMVFTDDEEVASVAKNFGARVPFLRPAPSAEDFAGTADVPTEVLEEYRRRGQEFSYGCCLHPNAPFVTAEKLNHGLDLLLQTGADSVVPVVRLGCPVQRALKVEDGRLTTAWPGTVAHSEEFPPAYRDSRQFYFFRVSRLLETGRLIGAHTVPIFLPESEAQQIDTQEDWLIAEMKYRILSQSSQEYCGHPATPQEAS